MDEHHATETKQIRQTWQQRDRRVDSLAQAVDALAMTQLSEHVLRAFVAGEPDRYITKDLKIRYR